MSNSKESKNCIGSIDSDVEIQEKLKLVASLREAIAEADRDGGAPIDELEKELAEQFGALADCEPRYLWPSNIAPS